MLRLVRIVLGVGFAGILAGVPYEYYVIQRSHFRNLRVARNGLEKAVDVDSAHRFGKRDVLRGRQILIAEEDDAVLVQCLSNFSRALGIRRIRQIDAEQFGAERTRCRANLKSRVSHDGPPGVRARDRGAANGGMVAYLTPLELGCLIFCENAVS